MISASELKESQGVVYQTLNNALTRGNIAQGYLFIGDKGSIMMDTALLLAKSILCDNNGFACLNCDICERVENGTYTDLVILDGSEKSIKKEQILLLQEKFSKTALEAYGKKIYIVNACENATSEALNSLLKFLEEPGEDTYAILITYQIDRVLETIVSRCQNLKFKSMNTNECINECIAQGIDVEDASIVSHIVNDVNKVSEITLSKHYSSIKSEVLEFVKAFQKNPDLGGITLQAFYQTSSKSNKFEKSDYILFINMLLVFYQQVVSPSFDGGELWNTLRDKEDIKKMPIYIRSILEVQDDLQRAPNIGLLFDRLIYKMKQ